MKRGNKVGRLKRNMFAADLYQKLVRAVEIYLFMLLLSLLLCFLFVLVCAKKKQTETTKLTPITTKNKEQRVNGDKTANFIVD